MYVADRFLVDELVDRNYNSEVRSRWSGVGSIYKYEYIQQYTIF